MNSPDRPLLGIGLMLIAMAIIPGIDICSKMLSDKFHVFELTAARYVFHLLWLIPVMLLTRTPILKRPRNFTNQFLRGLMLAITTIFFFYGIAYNPIPNVLSLTFIAPILVTLASPIILGEKLGPRRILAAIIGFIGVLIILNPSADDVRPSLLWGLAAGVTFAAYQLVTRKMSGNDTPLTTLFWTGLIGLLIILPTLPFIWVTPNVDDLLIMFAMGFFAAFGHYFIILAFEYGEASLLAPFGYFEIVTASLASLIIFQFWPAPRTWLGIFILIAAGIYIWVRERQLALKETADIRRPSMD